MQDIPEILTQQPGAVLRLLLFFHGCRQGAGCSRFFRILTIPFPGDIICIIVQLPEDFSVRSSGG